MCHATARTAVMNRPSIDRAIWRRLEANGGIREFFVPFSMAVVVVPQIVEIETVVGIWRLLSPSSGFAVVSQKGEKE